MEAIEKATGKQIIRIETNDLDEMEEVSQFTVPRSHTEVVPLRTKLIHSPLQQMKKALK